MFNEPLLVASQAAERIANRFEVHMHESKNRMSFTFGGLMEREAMLVAQLRFDAKDWREVRERCLSQNLFQVPNKSSAKRTYHEVESRLWRLSADQLDLVAGGDVEERRHLIWFATCRRYRFIAQFAAQVVRERLLSGREFLLPDDFDSFFHQRLPTHPELALLSYSTRKRLRQNTFRLLREAGITNGCGTISAVVLSPRVLDCIEPGALAELIVFPMSDLMLDRLTS